jgi:hypothetical protein
MHKTLARSRLAAAGGLPDDPPAGFLKKIGLFQESNQAERTVKQAQDAPVFYSHF